MAVQQATIGTTTVAGLVGIVNANAQQQIADEANISTLQAQVANLMKSASPPGAYSPPTKAGSQFYATASAWNYARTTGAGGLLSGTATTTQYTAANLNISSYADVWVPGSNIDLLAYINQANGYLTFARVQRPAQGGSTAPTIIASVSFGNNYYSLMAVCITSGTTARVTVYNSNSALVLEYTLSFSNNSLTLTAGTGNAYQNGYNSGTSYSLKQMRAFLCGSSSWVAVSQGQQGSTLTSGTPAPTDASLCQKDRGGTNFAQVAIASSIVNAVGASGGFRCPCVADQVGNNYFLRSASSWTAADGTVRPAVMLEYVDDYSAQRLQTLRITNTTFGQWYALMCVSPTLAIGVYSDASGNYWAIAISVNIGQTTPLGLYGPVQIASPPMFQSFLFFDATDIYFPTSCTGAGLVTFAHLAFSTSSPYLTYTAGAFTCQLYSGTTLTGVVAASIVQTNTDQFGLNYSYTAGSTFNSGYEVFNLTSS